MNASGNNLSYPKESTDNKLKESVKSYDHLHPEKIWKPFLMLADRIFPINLYIFPMKIGQVLTYANEI